MRRLLIVGGLFLCFFVWNANVLEAASIVPQNIPGCNFFEGLKDQDGFTCVLVFLGNIARFLLGFTGVICLIMIMIGGYQIAIGSVIGDKEQGKSRIIWSLVGLLVCILAYAIVNTVVVILTG